MDIYEEMKNEVLDLIKRIDKYKSEKRYLIDAYLEKEPELILVSEVK